MPKVVDYPRASFDNAVELAEALYKLGDDCAADIVAESMNRKLSGAFTALSSASSKYGLIVNEKGKLKLTELGVNLILSYDEAEEISYKTECFFNIPVFSEIYEKFLGKVLPVGHLDKILIREHSIPQKTANRVKGYLVDLAESIKLLSPEGEFTCRDSLETKENNEADSSILHSEAIPLQEPIKEVYTTNKNDAGRGILVSIISKEKGINLEIIVDSKSKFLILESILDSLKSDYE